MGSCSPGYSADVSMIHKHPGRKQQAAPNKPCAAPECKGGARGAEARAMPVEQAGEKDHFLGTKARGVLIKQSWHRFLVQ